MLVGFKRSTRQQIAPLMHYPLDMRIFAQSQRLIDDIKVIDDARRLFPCIGTDDKFGLAIFNAVG